MSNLTPTSRSISAALLHWAETSPDRLALTSSEGVETFAELQARADFAATELAALGVVSGDRVMVVGHNTPQWVHYYLAILRLGAIAAPTNNRLSRSQLAEQFELLEARLVVVDDAHLKVASACPSDALHLPKPSRGELGGMHELPALDTVVQETNPAVISFTSGTTGVPKGAVLNHRALCDASAVFAEVLSTGENDSTLVMVPLFHNTGFVDQLGQMLLVGGRTDLLRQFHTHDAINSSRARPATFVTAVPSILRLLMINEGADSVFGPARTVLYGGSPMPAAWSAELLERWPHLRLFHGYGLTEFTSACTFLPPEYATERGESVGFPAPGVRVRVVDADGVAVIAGQIGEVWAAGSTRMAGYWRNSKATEEKIRGEWLRTGDLGRWDGPFLYLEGRIDDVINRGGEKVLPSQVEAHIAALPGVGQVSVFGAPHPILQQRVVAAIEPRGDTPFDEDVARRYLSERLPDYAIPEEFFVMSNLPRTASGKLDRRAIRMQLTGTSPHRPQEER